MIVGSNPFQMQWQLARKCTLAKDGLCKPAEWYILLYMSRTALYVCLCMIVGSNPFQMQGQLARKCTLAKDGLCKPAEWYILLYKSRTALRHSSDQPA